MYDITQVQSVYDELTAKVKADLDEQFNLGRLKGSDYAGVYSKLMSECLQLAFKAPIEEKQIDSVNKDIDLKTQEIISAGIADGIKQAQSAKDLLVKDKQIDEINKKIDYMTQQIASMGIKDTISQNQSAKDLLLKDAEIATQTRQKQGFDDNMKLKMLETQLNAWSMMFSSGLLNTSPSLITNDEASALYINIKTELGL